jgi:hypothetical protein
MKVNTLLVICIIAILICLILVAISNSTKPEKSRFTVSATDNSESEKEDIQHPKNIKVMAGDGRISAGWDLVREAEYYTVYYSDKPFDDKSSPKVLGPIKTNSFEIGCIPKGTYYAKITSTKAAKKTGISFGKTMIESQPSPVHTIKVEKCSPPNIPSNVKYTLKDDGSAELTWDKVAHADGYKIYINESPAVTINDNNITRYALKQPENHAIHEEMAIASYSNECGESDRSYSNMTL